MRGGVTYLVSDNIIIVLPSKITETHGKINTSPNIVKYC
jgi:hypothetical protein